MKFELINYDVWGNPQDGFEVNNAYSTGIVIDISENDTDKTILKKLKEVGFLKKTAKFICFEIDGELDFSLYINHVTQKDGVYPLCELRRLNND
tara:strand:+ start:615 stop:896 length:282 start_codon:yes stop_codon:yes gene_type:complete